jgi:hypothetical protein
VRLTVGVCIAGDVSVAVAQEIAFAITQALGVALGVDIPGVAFA